MRGEDVREPPPGQYEPITDPEEELSMPTTHNIPAESLRCGDEIVQTMANGALRWSVQSAAVRGQKVTVDTGQATIHYHRSDRVTVRR